MPAEIMATDVAAKTGYFLSLRRFPARPALHSDAGDTAELCDRKICPRAWGISTTRPAKSGEWACAL